MDINSKDLHKYKKNRSGSSEQGFSILEAAIALTTLGVTLAYAMPLFLYSKMNNSKSEVRTGAMMVAQRILDKTRGTPFTTIPTSGTVDLVEETTSSPPTGSNLINLKAMDKDYTAKIYHCRIVAPATTSECTDNYKVVDVEIKRNGSTIYEMSAGFTDFK
jgi:Tfp pilus assembly protein PilV